MTFENALAQAKEWGVKLRYGACPWHKIVPAMSIGSAYTELHIWNYTLSKWEPAVLLVEQALGDKWETEPKPKQSRLAYVSPKGLIFLREPDSPFFVDGEQFTRVPWLDEPTPKIEAPAKPESLK